MRSLRGSSPHPDLDHTDRRICRRGIPDFALVGDVHLYRLGPESAELQG
jgi:hypothetical protein